MNKCENDILTAIYRNGFTTQRDLASETGCSLGKVNKALQHLRETAYLTAQNELTLEAMARIQAFRPKNAVILAAGYGMRMVPINTETPKGLIQIYGEALIERLIGQLHAVGITDITVVVGYMKESYEYLIDKYGVELVVNMTYAKKNTLHSLGCVLDRIDNTYIVPCDLWCRENPFADVEMYSRYWMTDRTSDESDWRINTKGEIVADAVTGLEPFGLAYVGPDTADMLKEKMARMMGDRKYNRDYWERAAFRKGKMMFAGVKVPAVDYVEINTYEQLRELDSGSDHLDSAVIAVIKDTLAVDATEIVDIEVLKKGMTNRSFLFTCRGSRYIMRIPGKGTEKLINRQQEYDIYQTIKDGGFADEVLYINPTDGYKLTRFIENATNCNPQDLDEVAACMAVLRDFHNRRYKVNHEFNLFEKLEYYEMLRGDTPSAFRDYSETKARMYELKAFIDGLPIEKALTHVDAVADNFLIVKDANGIRDVRLIDWEYGGMQDPHLDVAMFCIYALYDTVMIDKVIDLYFQGRCSRVNRMKIYCYIAISGLVWSNWCEFKLQVGTEFGAYSLAQYRYAKTYYKKFKALSGGEDE
ncbi:MAG: NTP transferase domain-containing protein [Tissierellia bacterium]|nr:NTP transferase domain-containing protein [Tissierellia bacterium]